MSEFTVKISGKQAGEEVSVLHAPLKEVREVLDALYALIARTSDEPEPAAVSFRDGSLALGLTLPSQTGAYLAEVLQQRQPGTDEPYMVFIRSLERSSRTSGLDFAVLSDDVQVANVTPRDGANLQAREARWIRTTLTLTGRIQSLGGKRPNIHVVSEQTGETLIVAIDQKAIQELRPYQRYVFDVQAEQAFDDPRKLRNLKYRAHLSAQQRMGVEELIAQEAPK
jgi:hypothetical protein